MSGREILKVQLLTKLNDIGILCSDVNDLISQYSGPTTTVFGSLSTITEKSAYCSTIAISYNICKPYGENGILLNALIWGCNVEIKIDFAKLHDRQFILNKLLNGLPSDFNRSPILVRQLYRAIDKMIADFYWRCLSQNQEAVYLMEQYFDRIELNRRSHNTLIHLVDNHPYKINWNYVLQI